MSTPASPSSSASVGPVPQLQPSTSDAAIRALAQQLIATASTPPPLTLDQGIVVDINPSGTPPTCSITLGGSATQIDSVRYLSSYTPVIGDTIVVLRQNGSPLVVGHTADLGTSTASTRGWAAPTSLGSGCTTNGNSNGPLMYRKVMDNGSWKMQWQGSIAVTGSPTTVCTLTSDFAPAIKRTLTASRSVKGFSETIDFGTNGVVSLTYDITHQSNLQNIGSSGSGDNSDSNANHGGFAHHHNVTFDHFHEIDPPAPAWVSFNGLEYFL